jgi:hypothetical protein
MKRTKLIVALSVALLAAFLIQAQSFQNLNFEQADPIVVPGTLYVTESSALPDWTVTIGVVEKTQITENGPSLGSPWVSLVGPGDEYNTPIDGNYSVYLQGSFPASAAISQTGLIPADTQSLTFEAEPIWQTQPAGSLELQIGSQVVPFAALATGPNYTLYGANIAAWAGDTEQLTFTAMQDSNDLNNWELDDISFSTNVVASPEPNMVALSAIGGLLFGARKWFARR